MGIQDLRSKTWAQNNKFKVKANGGPLVGTEHCIKSVQMPDFTRSAVEEYYNSGWNITYGREEIYILSLTYIDNEEDNVYKKVVSHWDSKHRKYPQDEQFTIDVMKTLRSNNDSTYSGVTFSKCIVDSVSGLQLDNATTNTIIEFTVTLKCKVINAV